MFDGPFDPFFGPRRPRIQRRQRNSWNTSYTSCYENEVTPYSSYEDMRALALAPPLGPRITETRVFHPLPFTDLPGHVNALIRRGATLSTYLTHLAAVMEPLTSVKIEDMGKLELKDVLKEGKSLGKAIVEFEEQFDEVKDLMAGLMTEKRGVMRKLQGGGERGVGRKGCKDDF
ncbi:uncharacterized protein M421DRAFT_155439 [Didymella exigua CBS 183.55]|uniref:Uncharacterized protein n=1 Tax=Didymella exigua CBS 183.55 TaxID=1150837 RepID=A0A6A5RKJ6_9PLEO|nr:uncharacterized protein M421DRAFT_155439 [Didymella exigua CBS 183.55]KAF1928159.1 hypothetical protein M421DRAFT_155439 [Didymella exigua CBS 183.55]